MTHVGRGYWRASFEITQGPWITGDGFPAIIVRKWEENDIGERRLVASFVIPAHDVKKYVGEQTKVPA